MIVVTAHLKTKSFYIAMLLVTMKRNHLSVSNAERNLPKLVFFVTTENDILKLVPSNADIAKRDFTLQIRYFGFFFDFHATEFRKLNINEYTYTNTHIKIFIYFSFANMSVFIPEKLLFHVRTAESVLSAIVTYLNINEYTWKIVQSSLPNNYSVIVER